MFKLLLDPIDPIGFKGADHYVVCETETFSRGNVP